jgi:hypothetical protein
METLFIFAEKYSKLGLKIKNIKIWRIAASFNSLWHLEQSQIK